MFGSDVLDVAIGVTLLFLFVSLICSAIQEAIEAVLKWRAMDLERGIRELLQDQGSTGPSSGAKVDGGGAAAASLHFVRNFRPYGANAPESTLGQGVCHRI